MKLKVKKRVYVGGVWLKPGADLDVKSKVEADHLVALGYADPVKAAPEQASVAAPEKATTRRGSPRVKG